MAQESSWTDHVLAGAAWRRFGFMLIFVPILCCAIFLMGFTALFQFFSMLASGETNPQLTSFGHGLTRFSAEIMDYLTYNTEQRPFPFSRWRSDESRRRSGNAGGRPRATSRRKRANPRRQPANAEPVTRLRPRLQSGADSGPDEDDRPETAGPEEHRP